MPLSSSYPTSKRRDDSFATPPSAALRYRMRPTERARRGFLDVFTSRLRRATFCLQQRFGTLGTTRLAASTHLAQRPGFPRCMR